MNDERVAIVGRGRFGGALATLVERAGLAWTAHDVGDPPPPADATLVVLAVPLDAIAGAAARVHESACIIDVASVKVEAERALASSARGPWCATHPLFGPNSVERAKKVIVCPNASHPEATSRARAFWERLGCAVKEMSAEEHDRLMASTQAIAFFLGEGLREAGLGDEEAWGPPSAAALHELAHGVTTEGGHVKEAILERNPFAAEARARLRAALEEDQAGEGLAGLRARIDVIDARIIELLALRAATAREISREKQKRGLPVQDLAREAQVHEARRATAEKHGVDVELVRKLFDDVMRWSRAVQDEDRER